jgi:hypothetical protein
MIVKYMEVTPGEFQDFIPFEKADVKAFLKDDQHKDAFRSFIEKHKPELKRFLANVHNSFWQKSRADCTY